MSLTVQAPVGTRAARRKPSPSVRACVRVMGLCKNFPLRESPWREFTRPFARPTVKALADVSFDVGRGELFGILGPNGAGKTTLFKTLSTLLLPDRGTVTVSGYDVAREGRRVRSVLVPVVPDERSLFWRLTALENLRLFGALLGLRKADVNRRASEVLDRLGPADASEVLVGTFSSGMKQRLLLGRALLGDPQVLLLDEPTRSLDPVAAKELRAFIRDELVGRDRRTVLLATHNTEEALELCRRLIVLDRGRVVARGTPAELLGTEKTVHLQAEVRNEEPFLKGVLGRFEAGRVVSTRPAKVPGWVVVNLEVPPGPDGAARALGALAAAGVAGAEFKPVPVTLADVLQRLTGAGTRGTHA